MLLCPWDSLGKNIGEGCYLLLQEIFLTQGSNPSVLHLLHWQVDSLPLAGDLGSIPGSGRSPDGGHGDLLQYSCLENRMDRGVWRAAVHGVAKSRT